MRIVSYFIFFLLLAGCAGRPGKPAAVIQPDDAVHSCATLNKEIEQITIDLARLQPEADALAKNNEETKGNFMSYIFLAPLAGIDNHHGQQQEIDAFRLRRNHLELVATEKNCSHL